MSVEQNPRISLIIVNYNGAGHLVRCLESVAQLHYDARRIEVIVVDNGSTDGSVERVRDRYPHVRLLMNDVNNYCRANNLAIARAAGTVIGLLNNDVRLDARWLQELLPVLRAEPRIGGVTGKTLFEDGRIGSTGQMRLPHGIWADRGMREPDVGQYQRLEVVDGLTGAAALYRRACLDDVGPLDEDFHMYYEDVDVALRCRDRGWKLVYVPTAVAYHALHGTATEAFVRQQTARNRLLLMAKHAPGQLREAFSAGDGANGFADVKAQELLRILPDVVMKLHKHSGADGCLRWLPGICEGLGHMINRERLFLADRLHHEETAGRRAVGELDQLRKALLDAEALSAAAQERCVKELADERAASGDAIQALRKAVTRVEWERDCARQELEALRRSTAYRWLVRPLWTALSCLRRPVSALRDADWEKRRILVVKPFHVSTEEARCAMDRLRQAHPQARFTLLAHLFPHERAAMERVSAETRWLYDSQSCPLTPYRLVELLWRGTWSGFAEGILLAGGGPSGAYRKGLFLLAAITPRHSLYRVRPDAALRHGPRGVMADLMRAKISLVGLAALVAAFVLVVWLPLCWRRWRARMR